MLSLRFKVVVYLIRGLDFIMACFGSLCAETLKSAFTKTHPPSGLPEYHITFLAILIIFSNDTSIFFLLAPLYKWINKEIRALV